LSKFISWKKKILSFYFRIKNGMYLSSKFNFMKEKILYLF
jgi:hypothetical protein